MERHTGVEKALGYTFNDPALLALALTHSSHANEHGGGAAHNERLEFLGDAVLELCVSSVLFERFPDAREGELTRMRAKIVSEKSLAMLARKMGLDTALHLGKGEESQGGRERDSIVSDAFEAVLGAVYRDGGFMAVASVVAKTLEGTWPARRQGETKKDCKSLLQEVTQRLYKDRPLYTLLESSGPEHAKVFTVKVTLPDGREFTCQGPSLKRAEQLAANLALEHTAPGEIAPLTPGESAPPASGTAGKP